MNKRKVIEEIQTYLAGELAEFDPADADAAEELKRTQLMYKFLPVREFGAEDVVVPSALVELELLQEGRAGLCAYYLVVPSGGGLVTRVEGQPVQVITPQSPLGEAMLGRKAGDIVDVEIRGTIRRYRIVRLI